jgi:signal transduction histidine kinase
MEADHHILPTEDRKLITDSRSGDEKLLAAVGRDADRLKEEFFELVSHELRTPLTSIIGYLELMLEEDGQALGADERQSFLRVMKRNSERLLAMVGDLLFVSKVNADRFTISSEPMELATIAAGTVDAAAPLAAERSIGLFLACHSSPVIRGDPARIAQLLDKLVANGIQHSDEGERVTVELSDERVQAVIVVNNSGSHIEQEDIDRLFDRFFRAARADREMVPGIGLGLTIVKAIVDAHGGRIEVSSDVASGTSFRVELPLGEMVEGSGGPLPQEVTT